MHASTIALWEEQAHKLPWFSQWQNTLTGQGHNARWFKGGTLNASYACLDIHLPDKSEKKAIIWQNEAGAMRSLSYKQLHDLVNKFAHLLSSNNVKKGDIVIIYMPMIPEALAAMLAVARLGAIHSVVFSGFSPDALKDRIIDTQARFVITAESGLYRSKQVPLLSNVQQARVNITHVNKIFVVTRTQTNAIMWSDSVIHVNPSLEGPEIFVKPAECEANHPLFILYTSGTTGKPKGIVHSTGGYLTYIYSTIKWAFDISDKSIYWCTADIGWITGHSYVTYGPLLHGATIIMYEGAPDYPNPEQWWSIIQKYGVTIFYTSPTALRMFIKHGDSWILKYDRSSLKILGSVGEPINPEVWRWFYTIVGNQKCPVIDTWWQTETGGFMIAPMAGKTLVELKPGSATRPIPGIDASIVDSAGSPAQTGAKGHLVINAPWPGMSIGIHNDPERFREIYFTKFPEKYYSYDYATCDSDGYFWLLGRADEVLNIAGHRIGTAEVESAAIMHPSVAEAAAIGMHDEIKGEHVVLFVILKTIAEKHENLTQEIIKTVRTHLGAFITPQAVHVVEKLPKTRSGKIMRRVLKAQLMGQTLGDTSTLED